MALKQTYSCDKCGHEQPNANQMWDIGIGVDASDGPYRITSALRIKAMWCRKCVEDARLLPVPSHEPQRELPPQPTLEDLIREIAGQVIHMSEKKYLAEIDKAQDAILAEMRVAEVVKRDCSRRHLERGLPAECGWPECGCDPMVFAQDILSAQPRYL